ncbi:MAG: sulfite exporter TauE/SafE family protein [Herbinix sp.]|nr:sulfite exporter TauE/SafE family protein [Herbinix sp.]
MNYLMIFAVVCAYIVKGMCGFANTLVFSTILSFQANNINITPIELILGYPSNLIIAWKERKSLSAKVWLPLTCLVIAGSIPGTFFLKNGNTTVLKIIFGFVVVIIGTEMLFREFKNKNTKASPFILGIIGLLSGLLCGLFGIGALLAAYVSRTTDTNSAFRGNLCIVFLIENSFRIILYSFMGIITLKLIKTIILLVPFMIAGLAIGILLAKVMNEKIVKKVFTTMLILSGISLIINNIGII